MLVFGLALLVTLAAFALAMWGRFKVAALGLAAAYSVLVSLMLYSVLRAYWLR